MLTRAGASRARKLARTAIPSEIRRSLPAAAAAAMLVSSPLPQPLSLRRARSVRRAAVAAQARRARAVRPLLLRPLTPRSQAGAASAPAEAYVAVNRYRLTSAEHVPAFEAEVNARAEASKKEVRSGASPLAVRRRSLPSSRVS